MKNTLLSLLSLFASCFILFFANGLINVLLPVRMGLDQVDTDTIGMVLSLYFVGMLLGAIFSKNLIKQAGHIRVFAGCVALSAVSILICSLHTDPLLWGVMRILLGFCNACAFTAMESWLSDSATKENRGRLLSVYHATALSGLFAGQFLMNAADPMTSTLFVLSGILLALAVIPVAFSRHKGPKVEDVVTMSIPSLFKISPLAAITCFIYGIVYASMFNLLPVFAQANDINKFDLSLYIGCAIFGAFIMQFPVGYLSDKLDRRSLLLGMLIISIIMASQIPQFVSASLNPVLLIATLITGGILACLYPLSVAELLDKLKQQQMVSAMGTMILISAIGGVIGPYSASVLMNQFGSDALFYFIISIELFLAIFVVIRMKARQALPVAEQESFVAQVATAPLSSELDPRTQFNQQQQPLSAQAQIAQQIAELDPGAAVKMARAIAIDNPEHGVEVASAVAAVEGINVLRLYEVMKEAAPFDMPHITQAIINTKPELAYQLVSQLAIWYPNQVVSVAMQISESFPELRNEMARVAVESAPESATQVAEYYANVLAQEQHNTRPADRQESTTQTDAVSLAQELWQSSPQQALDVTVAMIDNVPEAAASLTQGYITNTKEQHSAADSAQGAQLLSRVAKVSPQQVVDVAVAVADSKPQHVVEIATDVANLIHEQQPESPQAQTVNQSVEQSDENKVALEIVQRLANVSPEDTEEVAAAVIDAIPSAASQVVSAISTGDEPKEGEWVELIEDKPVVRQ
ncbi:MFS transporter [Psychrobium sp. 1_MG-2023]|uniref:MFS transporter n=1 Tax=Psychrobium sp. 1_MG-2023 TaxID=3062624 RepID=UPI000C3220E6|nr:MFS transporter [Psychrobium sp. 1_MG-2023]MDP2561794.1 MFS transporter [Psychrobium sp. 1_MG-2023]PKF55832.1 MFS transporter [Alteromonadales bacterium alter-6D02]